MPRLNSSGWGVPERATYDWTGTYNTSPTPPERILLFKSDTNVVQTATESTITLKNGKIVTIDANTFSTSPEYRKQIIIKLLRLKVLDGYVDIGGKKHYFNHSIKMTSTWSNNQEITLFSPNALSKNYYIETRPETRIGTYNKAVKHKIDPGMKKLFNKLVEYEVPTC